MKITCESCGAKYTIADDKVLGRKVKIRCKGCSTPIVVDGQKLGPSGAPPAGGDVKPETMVPSPSTLIPTPSEWSVNFSETDQRTLSTQQILEGYQSGQIPADVYVWRDGMADWVPLLECAELAPLLAGAPALAAPPAEAPPPPGYGAEPAAATAPASFPAPPAEPAAVAAPEAAAAPAAPAEAEAAPAAARLGARAVAPAGARETQPAATPEPATASRAAAARVSGGRSAGAHDLFAGVETAGAENLDAPISAGTAPALPQAGSTAYNDDRPTGARNENSVLFSLDSLKATNPAPAPKAGGQSAPDDPFGMGGSSSVASIGGGNALFTLADNQRLLSAPPPPPEPPPKAVSVASAVPSLAPAAMTRKTLGIVIGGVVAVLLLGVGIGVAVGGGDDKDQDEAASATAAASAAPEEKKEEKEEKAEKKEEEPAAPPAESATAKAEEKPAEEPKSSSTTPPASKPGQASKPAPKKEEAAPVVADQPFNRGAAVSAMSAAASQAASCKKPGGPTGSGKATLTFAPSGRVTSASVTTPPFAGTAVGGCVASVFRRAKVPPFTGNPITVSKSFTIR